MLGKGTPFPSWLLHSHWDNNMIHVIAQVEVNLLREMWEKLKSAEPHPKRVPNSWGIR